MTKKTNIKTALLFSFLGLSNILNAQENFTNSVTISEDINGYNWPSLEIHGFGGAVDNNNAHPVINFVRKNGTHNAPSFTKNGDQIGVLGFAGFDGTNVVQNVRISAYALSDYTNGNYANRLDFLVGGNATCCGETRMSINGVTGNVGIGTINPTEKLEVNGSIKGRLFFADKTRYANSSILAIDENFEITSLVDEIVLTSPTFVELNAPTVFISNNLGIGTYTPTEKLEVNGNILLNSFNVGNENGLFFRSGFSSSNKYNMSILAYDHNNDSNPDGLSINGWDGISFSTGSNIRNERMRITQTGNVGIGTANPDSKLTVKGSIHAEEVKVDLAIAPDYVFEKYYDGYSTLKSDYKMPTLQEVEAYTKENKHLPEVPSAQEIKENGLKLGEMNAILLQKVEELTLYLIEQNKEIEKLKTKVDELSKK